MSQAGVRQHEKVKDTNSPMHQKLDFSKELEPKFDITEDNGIAEPTTLNMNESKGMPENSATNVEDAPTSDSPYCGLKRIRLPNNETLELAILAWYNMQISSGAKVRGVDIQEKASTIAKEMGEDSFVASSGWLWKFKIRNGIKITKRTNNDKYDHGHVQDCGDGVIASTEADSHNGQVKRKRASLTVSQKLRILEELENGSSPANICDKYGIARQTVSDIRKRKDKLRRFASDFNTINMNERRSLYEACQEKPLDELLWIDGEFVEVKVEENDDTIAGKGDTITKEREEGDGTQLDEEDEPCHAKHKQTIRTEAQKLETMKELETGISVPDKEYNTARSTASEIHTSPQPSGSADTNDKRKRVSVTIAQKLEIINKLETGISVAKICAEYGIKKQTVSDIKKSKSKLEHRQYLSLQKQATVRGVEGASRSCQQETLVDGVGKWYLQELERCGRATNEEIREKAETNARCLGLNNFSASEEWMQKFKNRYRLSDKMVKQGFTGVTYDDPVLKSTRDSILDPGKDSSASNSLHHISDSDDSSTIENRACVKEETEERTVNKAKHNDLHLEPISDRGKDPSAENASYSICNTGDSFPKIEYQCDSDLLAYDSSNIKEEDIKEETQEEPARTEGLADEARRVQMRDTEHLTVAEKLDITRKLESGTPIASICMEYGLTEQMVLNMQNLEEFYSNMSSSVSVVEEHVQTLSDNSRLVDEAVYKWYIEEYKCRGHVNPQDILANAARLARTMSAKYFTASIKWLCGFKYRYMLSDEMLSLEDIDGTKAPRVRLTVAQKLAILEKLDSGASVTKVSAEYGVAKQTVSGIRKSRHKIEAFAGKNEECSNPENSLQCGRKVIRAPDALDEAVHKWYIQEHSRRSRVSGRELQETARRKAQELGVENFSASSGWLWKFRTRHGLAIPKESREETWSTISSSHSDSL